MDARNMAKLAWWMIGQYLKKEDEWENLRTDLEADFERFQHCHENFHDVSDHNDTFRYATVGVFADPLLLVNAIVIVEERNSVPALNVDAVN